MPAQRIHLSGQVQGVGFRPFVYRLATELGVRGWVKNITGQVEIHAEAENSVLHQFTHDLITRAPAIAHPDAPSIVIVEAEGHSAFSILESESGPADIHIPPDYFTCPDCLLEMSLPADRRHGYPFINCTQCGPRYTLINALPYDRAKTTMANFPLCPACKAEYEDPSNRRYHAEPVACPTCGPHLELCNAAGAIIARREIALDVAITCLRDGNIVAVKGIGGYHLLCDAHNPQAIATLRLRKARPSKPLALIFPEDGIALHRFVHLTQEAEQRLRAPSRPILLLPSKGVADPLIAPGLNEIGCFLPYSPLHHLLTQAFAGPLVATSGNISGEPVMIDNAEAQQRLAPIANVFLHHNRPISRPADDSVFRFIAGQARPLRLGRGTSPLEVRLPFHLPDPVLALGSHMKNTICLAWSDRAVISPHIGDLDSIRSQDTLGQVANDLQRLYQVRAERLLLDQHPNYGYRRWAQSTGLPLQRIWHHHAHASALAGEFPDVANWIVFTWDGVGLGEDGTLWGGEAFVGRPGQWQRRASLRPFRLPGGDKAGRQPWRSAAALLWETGIEANLPMDLSLPRQAWERHISTPETRSAGRLFDAAAALLGICLEAQYEGEGPMRLEALAAAGELTASIPEPAIQRVTTDKRPPIYLADWSPLLPMLLDARHPIADRALHFHHALARLILRQAEALRGESGIQHVGLAGGVFQNRVLTELTLDQLSQAGFEVHLPQRLPVNDAGVSFGQVIEFLHIQPK